jgi:hypothetical protein
MRRGALGPNPYLPLSRVCAPAPQVSTTLVSCPAGATETLGIKMPFLVMIIKNMRKYFSFEVQARGRVNSLAGEPPRPRARAPRLTRPPAAPQVMDDKGIKRRFRASNFQARLAKRRWRTAAPTRRPAPCEAR